MKSVSGRDFARLVERRGWVWPNTHLRFARRFVHTMDRRNRHCYEKTETLSKVVRAMDEDSGQLLDECVALGTVEYNTDGHISYGTYFKLKKRMEIGTPFP